MVWEVWSIVWEWVVGKRIVVLGNIPKLHQREHHVNNIALEFLFHSREENDWLRVWLIVKSSKAGIQPFSQTTFQRNSVVDFTAII